MMYDSILRKISVINNLLIVYNADFCVWFLIDFRLIDFGVIK